MSGKEDSVDHLLKLIENNKVQEVGEFLQNTPDGGKEICETIGSKGFSPLHCAVFSSHADIVSLILSKGVDVNKELQTTVRRGIDWYEQGSTSLHIACSRRHTNIVEALLAAGASADAINGGAAGQSPLHVAAEHGYLTHAQCLVPAGVNLHIVDQSEEVAMHKAAKNGHSSVIMFLITNGAEVNSLNKEGYTPLMLAITEGHLKTTIILLENGADITSLDSEQNSLLSLAILSSQEDIIPLLLDNEVDINAQNNSGDTALHLACRLNQKNSVSLLIEVGADLNVQNQLGHTSLHLAVLSNDHNITGQLISAGVQREIQDNDGKLAIDCTNNSEIIAILTSPPVMKREKTILNLDSVTLQAYDSATLQETYDLTPSNPETLDPVHYPMDGADNQQHVYIESMEPVISPRAPISPRPLTNQPALNNVQARRNQKLIKPRKPNIHNAELQPMRAPLHENVGDPQLYSDQLQSQFQQPIGVNKATIDTLKAKVSGLESQILTLGLGDDKAVVLYRQYGKLNKEINLAKQMVRDYIIQNSRPLTPRMENNHAKSNSCSSPMDLPTPRFGAGTPRENKTNNGGRKFNPNFMVETVESLKSELQILRNSVKPAHLHKLNLYIGQVESMALAVITFAHVMSVTLVL